MAVNVGGALLYELSAHTLLFESDEAEVLWLIVLHFVDGSDDLCYHAKLAEVIADIILCDALVGKFAHVDLAGLHIGFLHGC